jgi:predicted nucleic acid-binding protein
MKLVFDSSVLSAFARAELLELLELLSAGHERFVPRAVLAEIERGTSDHPSLKAIAAVEWLEMVRVDSVDELVAFADFSTRLVSGERNVGEASVLAWAQVNGGVAMVDDQDAAQCGRENRVAVRRSLALLAGGLKKGILDEGRIIEVVEALVRHGEARFPCDGPTFLSWARDNGLL